MKFSFVVCLFILSLLTACSSVSIVPRPDTPGATVNPSDQSIKINNSGMTVSARVQDTAVGGYQISTAMASLYVTISNESGSTAQVAIDSFQLVDSFGELHAPVPPADVNAILNPDIAYFLPYPFVGYYDVVDLEQHRASTAMASEAPYIGTGLPAIELLTPLPEGALASGQQVSGMLYYNIEIIDEKSIELKASVTVKKSGQKLSYSFPFSIEK